MQTTAEKLVGCTPTITPSLLCFPEQGADPNHSDTEKGRALQTEARRVHANNHTKPTMLPEQNVIPITATTEDGRALETQAKTTAHPHPFTSSTPAPTLSPHSRPRDQAPQTPRNLSFARTFFVLDFGLDIVDCVARLHLQRDCLSRQGLDKDLHTAAQAQHQMEGGLLLNVVVCQGASVLKLLARKDQTLLVRRDPFKSPASPTVSAQALPQSSDHVHTSMWAAGNWQISNTGIEN
jgi:hypothetical protein